MTTVDGTTESRRGQRRVLHTEFVAMLHAAGVEVTQRSGSRVVLKRGAERIVVHRPHPEPEVGRATVRDIAAFLDAVGVRP